MSGVTVSAEPPPGAQPAVVQEPALGGGAEASLAQWTALRSPETGDVLLLGCVSTPIPGWVEDMRPSIEGRNLAFAVSSAQRLVGTDVDARPEGGVLALFVPAASPAEAARPGRASLGITRTFLGFSARPEVVTCFATCATPQSVAHAGPRTCDAAVGRARLSGDVAAPPPGLALGATTWAIHHPRPVLAWGAALAFGVGALAVLTRRRPRSRI